MQSFFSEPYWVREDQAARRGLTDFATIFCRGEVATLFKAETTLLGKAQLTRD